MIDAPNLKSLPQLLHDAADAYRDRPAMKMAGHDKAVSYGELEAMSATIAGALAVAGHSAGDRMILFSESRPEWMAAMFAIWELGITAIPLSPDTPPETLAAVFQITGASAVVTTERVRTLVPSGIPVLLLEELGRGEHDAVPEASLEIALLAFTSGSTSRPRAVELSQDNLLSNLKGLLSLRTTSPESNFLSMLPPAHLFELIVGHLGPLACGATVVYAPMLMPNRVIEALKQEKIGGAVIVPALLFAVFDNLMEQLIEEGAIPLASARAPASTLLDWLQNTCSADELTAFRRKVSEKIGEHLDMLVVGGAAYNPAWAAVAHVLNVRLEMGYGLTEASPIVSFGDAQDCPIGSVGRAIPGLELRISEQGEILARGPTVMRGYFRDPELTRETVVDDWLHTGDKGELDDDGFLFIRGRLKEAMVTSNGETIYPEDIEPWYNSALFKEHCVVPFLDDTGNDQMVLCAVPESAEGDEAELKVAFNGLRAKAPGKFRVSRMLLLHQPLPRSTTGNVQRRRLAQTLQTPEMMS